MAITGNKGEWSEIYALLKLLAQGNLHAADENLNKIEEMFFPIIKVIRQEVKDGPINEYYTGDNVEIFVNNVKVKEVSQATFNVESNHLLNEILTNTDTTFSSEQTEKFMSAINIDRISAPSADKTDIHMQIHDIQTGYQPEVGFSIKSQLGRPATLLNASKATNFVYRLENITQNNMDILNNINPSNNKIIKRMEYLKDIGAQFHYESMASDSFYSNLMMIDSRMDEIVAYILLLSYQQQIMNCADLVKKITKKNPLEFPLPDDIYSHKFKQLLTAVALGMVPSKPWDGTDDATGGYIFVTKKGDVLAYHIYNRDYFRTFLLNNTELDRGSTGRHGFAEVYKLDDSFYLNLNIQIRFAVQN